MNTQREKLALAVAHLVTQGKTQAQVGELLQIKSQAEVSRLFGLARERNWISWEMRWPPDVDQGEIEGLAFPKLEQLRAKLNELASKNRGVAVKRIRVVPTGVGANRVGRLETFGQQAAGCLVPLLKGAQTCAVAWGRTIKATVDAVPHQASARPEMVFMPISGEPINHTDTGVSPSTAASRLSRAFGCEKNCLSLKGVAARIPKELNEHSKIIRRFVNMCHAYRRIFGDKPSLIDEVDLILSGIGDIESSENDPWFRETAESEGMDDLSEIAAGNIGGVWIAKDPKKAGHRRRIQEINARWLGIQEKHFVACAQRGDRDHVPGVVVVAVGSAKAAIVARAIGMINHLVIDDPLASALLDLSG